jgi:hypothetical protein
MVCDAWEPAEETTTWIIFNMALAFGILHQGLPVLRNAAVSLQGIYTARDSAHHMSCLAHHKRG